MKMTRQELKGLIKECLVEILSEGLADTSRKIAESRQDRDNQSVGSLKNQGTVSPVNRTRQMIADKISFLPDKSEIQKSQGRVVRENHESLANTLTSDPIMASIFADTERNGAHKSMNESAAGRIDHEQMIASAGDTAAKVMLRSDPTDIFGDSAGKWAALAFAEKIPARS